MKKILLGTGLALATLALSGCGTKKADPIAIIENAPITTGDVQDFNAIVGGSRYSEKEGAISLFTFKGDNTFAVTVGEKDAWGPWIISEGKILLGESNLELTIVEENEIMIDGVQYLRNPEKT